ncbi:MAG: hypothetical protein K0S48_2559 [Ramlibacter sp.]|nr:hypothetical protein [Ramlibacter sp.]
MSAARALLLDALVIAPRRYRMAVLPPDAASAEAAGAETAIAWALEVRRRSEDAAQAGELFTRQLAELIRAALVPGGGDPAFQALVLRSMEPEVEEYVRLAAKEAADRRVVRSAVDAVAHPGKLRDGVDGELRDALAKLHELSKSQAWPELRKGMEALAPRLRGDDVSLQALDRLEKGTALRQSPAVQRYLALCEQRGPQAGTDAALASGRASARAGDVAEAATVDALRDIAELMNALEGGHRVVRGLRTPRGFPGAAGKAKDEWDAAIVREFQGEADVLLLVEVKAAPAAATPDFTRLARGLERLAEAGREGAWEFASADGPVRIAADALRRLQPPGRALPAHVIYACTAEPESRPQLLGAATRAVLLAEPASVAFARDLARGGSASHERLASVWEDLARAPRLRSALHQYDTARLVREAMLHPQDLLAAVALSSSRP